MTTDDNNPVAEAPELSTPANDVDTQANDATDDATDDSDLDTQGVDPEFEEIDVDGEKISAPKLTAEKLRAAMLRQADYTRKTQELSQLRQQSEAEIAQEKARIETAKANFQSVARVTAIDERLQQYANVDWQALSQSDPVTAQQQFFQYQQLKDARGQLVGQIQQHESQRALQEQQETAKAMQQANEVLGREIKGWSPEYAKQLREVARGLGASDKDLDGIRAPWIVKALHAQKMLSEMTKKAQAAPAATPATPIRTVTGASAQKADPDKMSIDEYMRHERKRLAKAGKL